MARVGSWCAAALTAFALASCAGDEPAFAPELPLQDCGDLVWERDVVGFFENWCAPCHSANIVPPWRQGAPESVNLETLAGVRMWAGRVQVTALGDDPRMPPAGGPSAEDRALVEQWLQCGMKGTETLPVEPCDAPVNVDGDRTVASQADADALCSAPGVRITGSLTVTGPAVFGCVCAVDGDLVLPGDGAGSGVEAPLLTDVGGDLALAGSNVASLRLPELTTVGGALTLDDQKGLGILDLPVLASVGGPVLATHLGPLSVLNLPMLLDVGGSFIVADGPALSALDAPRVRSVGGSVQFERLPLLTAIVPSDSLASVPGDLIVLETGVTALDDMRGYVQITGTLRIEGNRNLTSLLGFWDLTEVSAIEIVDNEALTAIDGFTYTVSVPRITVSGSPSLIGVGMAYLSSVGVPGDPTTGLFLADLPSMTAVDLPFLANVTTLDVRGTGLVGLEGFSAIDQLASLVVVDNPALLTVAGGSLPASLDRLEVTGNAVLTGIPGPPVLASLSGDLVLTDNPLMTDLSGLGALASVGGSVELAREAQLGGVGGLAGLADVGGSLTLTGLPHVTTVMPLSGVTSVGADLRITDNPTLPTADANALAGEIEFIGGDVLIYGNG